MIKNRFKSLIVKQRKRDPSIKKEEKIISAIKQLLKSNIQKIEKNLSDQEEQNNI